MRVYRSLILALAAVALLAGGCPATSTKPDVEQPKEPPEGANQIVAKGVKLDEPDPGKALIYVVRPDMKSGEVPFKVLIDGEEVGTLVGGKYLVKQVDPGSHTVVSESVNKSSITVKAEADKTYYLKQEAKEEDTKTKTKLVRISEEETKQAVAKCKRVKVDI